MYKTLRSTYSANILNTIVPITYILNNPNDVKALRNSATDGAVYIAKKNIQRQSGVVLFTDPRKILGEGYVVVQELLQTPFLINKKKINIRVYLLITINKLGIEFYIYNNGFLYYTVNNFKEMSINPTENITTGFDINRDVYKTNPLTIKDFKNELGPGKSNTFDNNLQKLFKMIKDAYAITLYSENVNIPGTKFLIYGCDVAPDQNLDMKLMEINKGPDLSFKDDDRDKNLKIGLIRDAFELVGIEINDNGNNNNNNKYIKIN